MCIVRDDLCVSSEAQVFEAVMKWINHDKALRSYHMKSLISKVRLALLTKSYLKENVIKKDIFTSEG